ncbi:MAG: ADP-ribosylation factor-like protein [Candidatus Thorarchaeota archaeon]
MIKISLVGLGGCGKTSLYSVAFAEKTPEDTKNLSPTILYETRRHPFLGLQVGIFDFGGQEQYRKEYLEKPEIFKGTDVLIPVVDLHDPKNFEKAKEYFKDLLDVHRKNNEKPRIFLFLHKFDTTDYQKELLDTNVKKAKDTFLDMFKEYDFDYMLTSIYQQDELAKVFRDILISSYAELKAHVEKAESKLEEIKAKIIISDVSGNVIVHNVQGVSSGLTLRGDLRDFIDACNTVRENIFMSDSAVFKGLNEDGKEIELHIFKYIISVLIMKTGDIDRDSKDKLNMLLNDMKLFADLIISAHSD